ncbi:Tad domain-containing protein [Salinispora arenicola]|uniref:Tad domain-containing protein n=1 Tax=Salinispora arenicola TaxID=168697 RepID=UPI0027DB8329|nr:Tad domain-containing protein [Salinispora arenicola]
MIGLAGDGAGYVRTTQRAHNIAAEAARAGGQAIRLPEAINGETKAVDTTKAIDAVGDYLTTAGITDLQATVDVDGNNSPSPSPFTTTRSWSTSCPASPRSPHTQPSPQPCWWDDPWPNRLAALHAHAARAPSASPPASPPS